MESYSGSATTLRPFLNPTVVRNAGNLSLSTDPNDSFPSFRNQKSIHERSNYLENQYHRLTPQREARLRRSQSPYSPKHIRLEQQTNRSSLSPLSYTASNIQQSQGGCQASDEKRRGERYSPEGRDIYRPGREGGFSAEYVGDLRRLHERELEEFEIRHRNTERNHTRVKESLLGQLESLRRQLEVNYKKHSDQLQQLTEENAQEIRRITQQKDQVINDLQRKNLEMTAELNEEGARCSQARQESLTLKTIKQLEAEGRAQSETIEYLKRENRQAMEDMNRRSTEEKGLLKREYEALIDSMQSNSNRRIDELREVVLERNREIDSLNSQLREIRGSFNSRLEALNHELEVLHESARASKRLQDVQLMENKNLKEEQVASIREIKLLSSELSLLDGEKDRLTLQNDDLKSGLAKLERLVYGKKAKKGRK